MAPSTPRALLRSEPSWNVTDTIEKTDGARIAAAAPCSARKAMSIPDEVETAHSREPTAKAASPIMNRRRRPSRSPARPPSSRNPPKVSE